MLLMLTAAANRDDRQFEEPDRFDVRRQIDHHVTFGYGLHFCMGRGSPGSKVGSRSRRCSPGSPNGTSTWTMPSGSTPRRCEAGTSYRSSSEQRAHSCDPALR